MDQSYLVETRYNTILNVLEDLHRHGRRQKTTVIICTTREELISQLVFSIQSQQQEKHHDHSENISTEVPPTDLSNPNTNQYTKQHHSPNQAQYRYHLLAPTLHLISLTKTTKLVYCPSLPILRAYLSVYSNTSSPSSSSSSSLSSSPLSTTPTLKIINLISLHHETSEFTFQGLSRTLAAIVSAGYRTGSHVRLIECGDPRLRSHSHPHPHPHSHPPNPNLNLNPNPQSDHDPDSDTDTDIVDEPPATVIADLNLENDRITGNGLWDVQIPLLNGSVKVGVGVNWTGRSVCVRRVVERWFDFG